jgi:hypothetical protein
MCVRSSGGAIELSWGRVPEQRECRYELASDKKELLVADLLDLPWMWVGEWVDGVDATLREGREGSDGER